jgi:hypothetical protein
MSVIAAAALVMGCVRLMAWYSLLSELRHQRELETMNLVRATQFQRQAAADEDPKRAVRLRAWANSALRQAQYRAELRQRIEKQVGQ